MCSCIVAKSRLCKTRGSTRVEVALAERSGAEDLEEEEQDQTPGKGRLVKAILSALEERQVFKRAIAQRTGQQGTT